MPPPDDAGRADSLAPTASPASTADQLVAMLPAIVWEADGTDYRMTYVSPSARQLLGHEPADWVARPSFWESHLHPDDRAAAIATVDRALGQLGAVSCQYRFLAADGTYRHFRDEMRVIQHTDGHRRIVGCMLDVSDEAAIEQERLVLATAMRETHEGILVADAGGRRVRFANPALERSAGRAPGSSRDVPVELVLEAWGRNPVRTVRMAMAGRAAWEGDLRVLDGTGAKRTIEVSITPAFDADDAIRSWTLVTRDVTTERAQREVRARLATIVESAADAAYVNALDGTYLAWNDAATRLYGWSDGEILGHTAYELVAPDEHPSIRSWLARVAAGETIGPVDTSHRGRDGRRLTLSVIAAPVRDEHGRVTGVATIARDVSEERRLAAERLALETQLAHAQKLEAVGRLAGGLAHDFNNMLTAILGYATAVAEHLDGPLLEDQRQVLHAAERAAELTRGLLAFSRPVVREPRRIDLDRAVRDGSGMLTRLVPERIDLVLDLASNATVVADPVEIEQVVLNLAINAAEAIAGTGRIDVSTTIATRRAGDLDDGPAQARVRVRDTGPGMDVETQARMFVPFFTTRGIGAGTGLGLATVEAIVRRLDGAIDVTSAPGGGTTIDVWLPAVAGAPAVPEAAAGDGPRGSERVLVVDDSEVVGLLVARMLERAGYRVTVDRSPLDVLARGVAETDLIVTDVVMPGMSGPELVSRLDTDLPVVFMSGYAAEHLPPDIRLGARRAFVSKPFGPGQLLEAARAVLDACPSVEAAVPAG